MPINTLLAPIVMAVIAIPPGLVQWRVIELISETRELPYPQRLKETEFRSLLFRIAQGIGWRRINYFTVYFTLTKVYHYTA